METNLVLRVQDLTPDFADGMRKLFSNATLFIRVQYGGTSSSTSSGSASPTGKRRGRPSKASIAAREAEGSSAAAPASATGPKKRGRKPGSKNKVSSPDGPKKRGRKPKVANQP